MKRILCCLGLPLFLLCLCACATGPLMDAQEFTKQFNKLDAALFLETGAFSIVENEEEREYRVFLSPEGSTQTYLIKLYADMELQHLKRCSLSCALPEGEDIAPAALTEFQHVVSCVVSAYTKMPAAEALEQITGQRPELPEGVCFWEANWFRYSWVLNRLGLCFTVENARLNPAAEAELSLRAQNNAR